MWIIVSVERILEAQRCARYSPSHKSSAIFCRFFEIFRWIKNSQRCECEECSVHTIKRTHKHLFCPHLKLISVIVWTQWSTNWTLKMLHLMMRRTYSMYLFMWANGFDHICIIAAASSCKWVQGKCIPLVEILLIDLEMNFSLKMPTVHTVCKCALNWTFNTISCTRRKWFSNVKFGSVHLFIRLIHILVAHSTFISLYYYVLLVHVSE